MSQLHTGQITIMVTVNRETGDETHRLQVEYPPEEALESLASRVRPLILSKESVYYDKAFDALKELVGAEKLDSEIDLAWWREYWHEAIDANLAAQAYWVATPTGSITDRKLMYAWLYGDVIHAQAPRSPAIRDLDVNQRYYAAAPGIARICDRVIYTSIMVRGLIDKGLLAVDPEVLEEEVVVSTIKVDQPVKAFAAELGAPLPTDLTELDPEVWKPVHESINDTE
jgi:hypothetical protein